MPGLQLTKSTRAQGRKKGRAVSVPGVGAVLKRAKTPYKKNPLSEDEALNLVCDARSDEPTHPIEKLFKKFGHELGG